MGERSYAVKRLRVGVCRPCSEPCVEGPDGEENDGLGKTVGARGPLFEMNAEAVALVTGIHITPSVSFIDRGCVGQLGNDCIAV